MSPSQYLSGIDASHWQGPRIDWNAVAASGIKVAMLKATQGALYVDPMLAVNHAGAMAAGVAVGLYHLFIGRDGHANFDNFIAQWKLYPSQLAPALDLEPGSVTEATESIALAWLSAVSVATGRNPLLYASPSTLQGLCDPAFKQWPLWIAHYGVAKPNLMGWKDFQIWQHSQNGTVAGIAGNCDLDWFNGSPEDLQALIDSTTKEKAT